MNKIIVLWFLIFITPLYASSPASNTNHVLIAAVQFPVLEHQSESDFISMVYRFIDEAHNKQVKIILFPELLTANMFIDPMHPSMENLSKLAQFSDQYARHLKSKAISSGMIIIGGTTVTKKGNKIYNTAIVAFPNGDIKTVNKTLLTPWELANNITGIGNTKPLSFETPWGTAVILICYESESPEILSMVSKYNPTFIFIPSYTSGISGLNRVTVAAKYASIAEFSYTLLTGMTTGISKEKIGNNDVGQAIFATPQDAGYPLRGKYGTFNQPDLLIVEANIAKLRKDKLYPNTTFASRDYAKQH